MTLGRSTAGINNAEDAGTAHRQIISTDALRRVFPTTVSGYLRFRAWTRQEILYGRSSVTFDSRQCAVMGNPTSITATSSAHWFASREHLPATASESSCFPPRTSGWPTLPLLQEDPDASAVVLLGRLQEAEPDRFSRAHLRTLQRRVQQWRGFMATKMVYATAGKPMAESPAMPELALAGVAHRC